MLVDAITNRALADAGAARRGWDGAPRSHRRGDSTRPGPRCQEESMLEIALTTVWMVQTGRRLGEPPHLHVLAAEQLIEFWAW